jgi:MFS family permease
VRAGLLLGAVLAPLGSTAIAVALPAVAGELEVDAGRLDLALVVSYLLVGIVGQAPGGALADRLGHGRAMLAGLGAWALGAVLGAAAPGLAALALARVLMAAGGAVTVPAAMALLRNGTAADRRARAFGTFGGVTGLAAAVGPLLAGKLVVGLGWRAIFLANLPVIAVSAALVARLARVEAPSPARSRPAWAPDLRLLGRRAFAAGSALIALQNLAMYALLFHLPVAFSRVAGAGPEETGRVLLALLGGMVLCAPIGGRVADLAGARLTACAGSLLALAGILLLPRPEALGAPSEALAALALLGAGLGLSTAPAQAAAMSAVGAEEAGRAAGLLSTMRYAGAVGGMVLLSVRLPGAGLPVPAAFGAALAAAAVLALLLPGHGQPREPLLFWAWRPWAARPGRPSIPRGAGCSMASSPQTLRRLAYVVAGGACVALGGVGLLVPGLPTTVFLLAAAWLFARSSPRLHARLLAHARLGHYLRAAEDRAMPLRCKLAALTSMWAGTGLACHVLREHPLAAAAVVALALVGTGVVLFRVETREVTPCDAEPAAEPSRTGSLAKGHSTARAVILLAAALLPAPPLFGDFAAERTIAAASEADVLGAEWSGAKIRWYENDGAALPAFAERLVADGAFGAASVAVARVDGDDDPDVVGALHLASKVAYYENLLDFSDADGDGVRDEVDCAPGDATAYAIPAEVRNVRFPLRTKLTWNGAAETCIAEATAETELLETSQPAPGTGLYFVVRGPHSGGASAPFSRPRNCTVRLRR